MATRPLRKAFIVRLCQDQDEQWNWQGEVQVAHTGEIQRVSSAGELLDCLHAMMMSTDSNHPAISCSPGLR